MIDREVYFDHVRQDPFGGAMTQQQVDGMNIILDEWELAPVSEDLRWLAYCLATTYHECAGTMWPIEEYGKGAGHDYGKPDPETGQTYYGRGFVQLTWKSNYQRATDELDLPDASNLVWHPENALDPIIASDVMFQGMAAGWFTGLQLSDYFNDEDDDPYHARAIVNGDVEKNGSLVAGYHRAFLYALQAATTAPPQPEPKPELVTIGINVSPGTQVAFYVNGEQLLQAVAAKGKEVA